MPITTINETNELLRLRQDVNKLQKLVKQLSSPPMTNVAIFAAPDVANLELYDGNNFISSDSTPTLCYVVGGVLYQITGSPS